MFEGSKECSLCGKELAEKERNFGISLRGVNRVFCDRCTKNRKEDVRRILHDEKA